MTRYTPKVVYKTKFDGDEITVTYSRLNRKAFFAISPFFRNGVPSDDETISQLMEVVAKNVSDEDVRVEGLRSAVGDELSWHDVVNQIYFMPLCAELVAQMIANSLLGNASGSS